MKRLNFNDPETIKKAASFPYYGQAESLVRTIDPLWKVDLSVEHEWDVIVERDLHYCDCQFCDKREIERKTVKVEARTPDDAESEALSSLDDLPPWDVIEIRLACRFPVEFPEWIYTIEGEA